MAIHPFSGPPSHLMAWLQLIMGGKQYAISPDEYVFAALSL
jgi:hypothetical protein